MAPEQATGQSKRVGPAADVWALGAILYACLTGRPPFGAATTVEILEQVRSHEPVSPARLNPQVPRDLETVCLKCLQKEPHRRYISAIALADDLRRWLDGRPITARPVGSAERAWRWCRRNPALAGSSSAVAVVVAACVIVLTVSNSRLDASNRQLDATNSELSTAFHDTEKERDRARAARKQTRDALDKMVSLVTGDSLPTQVAISPEQKTLLENALEYYEGFAAETGEDLEGRQWRAGAYSQLGFIRYRLEQWKQAVAAFVRATDLYGELAAEFPGEPKYPSELAYSHHNRGLILADLGKPSEAEADYRAALAHYARLAANYPNTAHYRDMLASTRSDLGSLLAGLNKWADAADEHRAALALYKRLAAESPGVPEYRRGLAQSRHHVAAVLAGQNKWLEAVKEHRDALAMRDQLVRDCPNVSRYRADSAYSRLSLGSVLANLEKPKEAEEEYRKAWTIYKKLVVDFPTVSEYRRGLAASSHGLGPLLASLGKRADAQAEFKAALALREKLAANFPDRRGYTIDLGGSYCNFGNFFREGGDRVAAIDWHNKAIDCLAPLFKAEPRLANGRQFLRNSYWGRAKDLAQLSRHADALPDWDQARKLADGSVKTRIRCERALSLVRADKLVEAIAEADDVSNAPHANRDTLYDCARVLALASTAPGIDANKAEQHAARAVALLRQAIAKGYADIPHLLADNDLAPLRNRADFADLLWDLADTPPGRPAPAAPSR
jgi:serine/threonine-protein kinase